MAHVIDSRGVDLGDITDPNLLAYYRREPGYTVGGVTTPANPARSSADILPVWAANTIYAAGQEILDPTGVTILVRQSTGTSRSTYDTTEQAQWSAAGAGGGGTTTVTLTPTAVKTANYTAAAGDLVPVDTTSGNVTVTLPTAPADKTQVGVKHVVRGGTNTVSIACGGSDVLNKAGGSTTATLTLLNQGAVLQYKATGAIWYVVSDDLALSQLDTRYALAGAGGSTYPSGAAATTVDRPLGWFDLRDYGAKIDGRQVFDAVTTSGSAIVTSATAAFTAGDVGKSVQIQSAAGVTLATTTVLSRQSATQITLNANASASATGAVLLIGTDDTAAVQSAINAAVTAGGGTIWHPGGICVLAAAPTTGGAGGGAYAGQLLLPDRLFNLGQMVVRLLGVTPAAEVMWGSAVGDLMPPEVGGSIFSSMATSGAVVDVISHSIPAGFFSNIEVVVENLLIRLPNAPAASGLRFDRAVCASVRSCTVGVNAKDITVIASPTSSTYGIRFPAANNAAFVECRSSQVYGFGTGIQHSEHFVGDNVSIYDCLVGIEPATAYHLSTYNRVGLYENTVHIKASGNCNLAGYVAFESKSTGGWWATQWDIDDPSVLLAGSLGFLRFGDSGSRTDYCYARTALNIDLWNISNGGPHSIQAIETRDTFTRENTTRGMATATSGQVWYPANNTFGISGGQAYAVNGAATPSQFLAVLSKFHPWAQLADHTISCDITTSSGTTQAGFVCRYINGNTFLFVAIIVSGATKKVSLQKNISGTYNTLGQDTTITYATSTTYNLSVRCTPTQVIVSVNGTAYITYTLTAGEQTTFNGSMRCGLAAFGGGGAEDGGSRWGSAANPLRVTSPVTAL